ncbi:MAG: phosphoribosylformylglycinamidine cyclo-ligase [Candidatus Aminicenantales bacterium]
MGLTYKEAGVDINRADRFLKKIKPLIDRVSRPEVLTSIGGFSGLFAPRLKGIKRPVLVSSTDGVGTKLLVAEAQRKYETVGIDLVAMCVDDVVVTGAEPLFFLDYIAAGRLDGEKLLAIMKGILRGCRQANTALIGGETAELPDLYEPDRFDLAGFCVGIVEAAKIIDGRRCRRGDTVIGLASSGLHSNGFSLARRVFTADELRGDIGRQLLRPTRIYSPAILKVLSRVEIKAMAHITGGGFLDNIPRVIPEGLAVVLKKGSWPIPKLFRLIQERGEVSEKEMFRTFNMGVGMVVVVDAPRSAKVISLFEKQGIRAWVIGELVPGKREVVLV